MSIVKRYFGTSPFGALAEHTRKVHDCVELLRPLVDAFVEGDYDAIDELHRQMSRSEHEADEVKNEIRDQLSKVFLLSVSRHEILAFLSAQDDVADAAEDFSVVLGLRMTKLPAELKADFLALVDQVITVSEKLLQVAEKLDVLAEVAFEGEVADRVLVTIDQISEGEWIADKLQRKFAEHYYAMENRLDPTTLVFYDRYCRTLGEVANRAEKCSKILRALIVRQ